MSELYKTKKSIGGDRALQNSFTLRSKSNKTWETICTPDVVIAAVDATAGIVVGKGSICRIFGTAADLVGFYPTVPGSVPGPTDPNVAMLGATVVTMIASDEIIRTTAGVTRVEVTTFGESGNQAT